MNRRRFLQIVCGALGGLILSPAIRRVIGVANGDEEEVHLHEFGLIMAKPEDKWEFHPGHLELHQGDRIMLHLTATEGEHKVAIPWLEKLIEVKAGEMRMVQFSLEEVETGEYTILMPAMGVQAEVHVRPPCPEAHGHE